MLPVIERLPVKGFVFGDNGSIEERHSIVRLNLQGLTQVFIGCAEILRSIVFRSRALEVGGCQIGQKRRRTRLQLNRAPQGFNAASYLPSSTSAAPWPAARNIGRMGFELAGDQRFRLTVRGGRLVNESAGPREMRSGAYVASPILSSSVRCSL